MAGRASYTETNPLATRHTELATNPNPSLVDKLLLEVLPASRPHSRAAARLQAALRGVVGRRRFAEAKAVAETAETAKTVTVVTLAAGHGTITCVAAHGGKAYVGTSSGSLQAWPLSPVAGSGEPLAVRQLTSGQPVVQLQVLPDAGLLLRLCAGVVAAHALVTSPPAAAEAAPEAKLRLVATLHPSRATRFHSDASPLPAGIGIGIDESRDRSSSIPAGLLRPATFTCTLLTLNTRPSSLNPTPTLNCQPEPDP